ncbi:MAG: hypothetical protein C4548_11850, partial [Desulfobacteraceae bacterium]
MKRCFSLSMIFLTLLLFAGPASAVTLTVGAGSGNVGDILNIDITVDEAETLAGAAFTLTYSDALTVSVDSVFFDTFFNQFDPLDTTDDPIYEGEVIKFPRIDEFGAPVLDEYGNPVYIIIPAIVDEIAYDQPLITNHVSDGVNRMLISAARCVPAAAGPATLFTLSVSLNPGRDPGVYPLVIVPTELNNTDAGYAAEGEYIHLLIGSDLNEPIGPAAFPVLLAHGDYLGSVVNGEAEFIPPVNSTYGTASELTGVGGQATGSNVGATKETGEPNHAGNAGGAS